MAVSVARRFSKMHGAGNDFVLLDLRDGQPPPDPATCRRIADRHTGVGCDQLLTIEAPRSAQAVASYRIWNADGSTAQQCGNGARCVAAWLARAGVGGERFLLDSPAGTHPVARLEDGTFELAMGIPVFAPDAIGLRGFDREQATYSIDLDGRPVTFGAASMGNPHALLVVDDIHRAPVAALGAALQAHATFADSVNVGFAQVRTRDRIALRVFERGVGETLACGSGACAAVAILVRQDRVDRDVAVELPGGTLQVGWRAADAPITLRGPAAFVFEGELLV
jgi:diaminopimelate epimerase